MTHAEAEEFAQLWVAAWNARDLEAIFAHYDDRVLFTSPRAGAVTGSPTIVGKEGLRAYWKAAVVTYHSLEFILDRTIWDPERSELVVVFTHVVNGQRTRAAEIMRFGPTGQIIESEALHGAAF